MSRVATSNRRRRTSAVPRSCAIPTRDDIEDGWDWNSEVFEREEDNLTHVSSWARDPEKALVELVEEGDRIATLEIFEAARVLRRDSRETKRSVHDAS